MKPPHDREHNHFANELTTLLTDDCVELLIEGCRDQGVRDAVAALLAALVKARMK